ncbi:MAG: NAD(P)H-hydrate epimerase, partial [Nitrospirota bacterium]
MKIASAKEMQSIDKRSINEYGISGLILMENAGIRVVEEVKNRYGNIKGMRITIISGKGNNGGDGFVVGRHLFNAGAGVRIFLLSEIDSVKGDARINLDAYIKIGGELFDRSSFDKGQIRSAMTHSHLLIDAIFGTGLSSSITGFISEIISIINRVERPVISIDIPSGISSDTGKVLGIAVEADMTVTFALPKQGHFLYPGSNYCGDIRIADISIPEKAVDNEGIKTNLITEEDIQGVSMKRKRNTHKGSYGHAMIIAGSGGKSGAALMSGISALRAGSGLVTVALPESISDMISMKNMELMTLPLSETGDKTIRRDAVKDILAFAADKEVIAIGPGISMNRETSEFVRDVVSESEIPIVVDADG